MSTEYMEVKEKPRAVFLNALPLGAIGHGSFRLYVIRVSLKEVASYLEMRKLEVVHYIRHPATLGLLRKYVPLSPEPNAGLYKYSRGDVLFIVTLKNPTRGAEVAELTENDVEVYFVTVS